MGKILLSLLFFNLTFSAFSQDKKPNIIFILTDDHRWDALGFAGNTMIRTPEMDRIAKEGIYYENAFVTTPICAASRASILTGLYERTHGYTFGQGDIQEAYVAQSYPVMLRDAGYMTGFFGKFGINYPGFAKLFDAGEEYDRNNLFTDRRGYFFKKIKEDTVHLSRYTSQQAIDFIANTPAEKPFMLSLSFSAPHAHDGAELQYFWSSAYDTLYQNLVVPDPLLSEDKYFQKLPEYIRTGENRTRWYWRFDTPEKYQRSVKGYFRMISEVDAEIGKIRKAVEAKGIAENTVIILMGDNGYFLGERQLAGKWLMYDNSLRVPLILYDPRQIGGERNTDFALNIDIPSTILDLAGVTAPKSYQGTSLRSNELAERKDFLSEHLWQVDIIAPSEAIRTERWKYLRYINDPQQEELYDLALDPLESNNLAADLLHQEILKELRIKMEQKIASYLKAKIQ